ncbi:DUF1048 domain-containing protein [Lactococcus allomyrinae]|uniref:DUF1048 domain-containing protein n=1 Tax=Lactococcus allomyrinae TaxID=2419773 RepID=A0A387BRJ8_9LACT|nr:DUF1048 domain-containing protein [Lactococcus allomyrinae]AYG01091.1 DUF1048 domain-containing protein [Lactococcus allomyrinae]
MTENRTLIDRMLGLEEKREWHEFEKRAKALGDDYYADYNAMKKYIWISGVEKWKDFKFIFDHVLDLLEEVAIDGRKVTSITGPDVATFLDEMVEHKGWEDKQKDKLNKIMHEK